MKRIVFVLVFLLWSVPAFATRDFYVSRQSGNDANTGLDTAHPWKSIPTMDCGSGWNGVTITGDDVIHLKYGDTWSAPDCFGWIVGFTGSSGHPVTIKGDSSWNSGDATARPIFDSAYMTAYMLIFNGTVGNYIDFKNIEMKRVTTATADQGGIMRGVGAHDINLTNIYAHGWRLTGSTDGLQGGIIFGGFNSAADSRSITMTDSVMENSENTSTGWSGGFAMQYIYTITNSTFHDMSGIAQGCNFIGNTIYNISYPSGNISPDGSIHPDAIESDPSLFGANLTCTIDGNIVHDTGSGVPGPIYSIAHGTGTNIIRNNVIYGHVGTGTYIQLDNYDQGSVAGGTTKIYNNLIYMVDASPPGSARPAIDFDDRGYNYAAYESKNNYFIGGTGFPQDNMNCAKVTGTCARSNNLPSDNTTTQAAATAISQGYLAANLWRTPNTSGSTYHTGADLSGTFTTDFNGVTRSGTWDIGPYIFGTHREYYVATTGSDSQTGTITLPFKTIHKCTQMVLAGDTCQVRAGTYNESVHIGGPDPGFMGGETTAEGFSWDNPITLKRYGAETVIWTQNTSDAILHIGEISGIDNSDNLYWIVDGFQFDGQSKATDYLLGGGSNYLRSQNNIMHDSKKTCFFAGGDHWESLGDTVHDCGTGHNAEPDHCYYWDGRSGLIDGSEMYHCSGYGVQMFRSGGADMSHNVIRNSRVHDNYYGTHTVGGGGGGIFMGTGSDNAAYNNLVYDTVSGAGNSNVGIIASSRCGLYSDGIIPDGLHPCLIFNNSIYAIHGSAINLGGDDPASCNPFSMPAGGPCTYATVKNNICYNNDAGCIVDTQSVSTKSNNLTTDPSYLNVSTNDFRIPAMSAAAAAGANLTSLCTGNLVRLCADFNNAARSNSAFDDGAYNAGGVAGTPASITAVSPMTGAQGTSVAIDVTGASTNFSNGSTVCTISSTGITIVSTTVLSATEALCNVTIDANAPLTTRSITMTTGGEVAVGTNVFTVTLSNLRQIQMFRIN